MKNKLNGILGILIIIFIINGDYLMFISTILALVFINKKYNSPMVSRNWEESNKCDNPSLPMMQPCIFDKEKNTIRFNRFLNDIEYQFSILIPEDVYSTRLDYSDSELGNINLIPGSYVNVYHFVDADQLTCTCHVFKKYSKMLGRSERLCKHIGEIKKKDPIQVGSGSIRYIRLSNQSRVFYIGMDNDYVWYSVFIENKRYSYSVAEKRWSYGVPPSDKNIIENIINVIDKNKEYFLEYSVDQDIKQYLSGIRDFFLNKNETLKKENGFLKIPLKSSHFMKSLMYTEHSDSWVLWDKADKLARELVEKQFLEEIDILNNDCIKSVFSKLYTRQDLVDMLNGLKNSTKFKKADLVEMVLINKKYSFFRMTPLFFKTVNDFSAKINKEILE